MPRRVRPSTYVLLGIIIATGYLVRSKQGISIDEITVDAASFNPLRSKISTGYRNVISQTVEEIPLSFAAGQADDNSSAVRPNPVADEEDVSMTVQKEYNGRQRWSRTAANKKTELYMDPRLSSVSAPTQKKAVAVDPHATRERVASQEAADMSPVQDARQELQQRLGTFVSDRTDLYRFLPDRDGVSRDKIVVIAHTESEDVSWVSKELVDWPTALYAVAPEHPDQHDFFTPINKGREALAYLSYIIAHYERLPAIVAFVHPHARGFPAAWHTDAPDNSNSWLLNRVDLLHVEKVGFANLRCGQSPGCIADTTVNLAVPRPGASPDEHMAQAWRELFPNGTLTAAGFLRDPPALIAAPCCAQFLVTRARIRARPLAEYRHFHTWLLRTPLHDVHSSRVFEYLWHIIFGNGPIEPTCDQDLTECRCRLYGFKTGAQHCEDYTPA